jgi:DNA-binding MarR family transcriptional regulator
MGVVSSPIEDTELARLFTQLLRVIDPALAADGGGAAGLLAQLTGAPEIPEGGLDSSAASAAAPEASAAASILGAISASEARALIELVAARGIAQGELGGLLGLEKSTVSRLAAGLERKGWVSRGRDEGNQRYVRLYLTPQGRAVAGRVLTAWQSRQERLLVGLTAEERAGLETGLRGLMRTMGRPADSGPDSGAGGAAADQPT